MEPVTSACQYAKDRFENLLKWRKLWELLLYVLGCAIVIFSILAISQLVREDWQSSVLRVIQAVASGAGAAWVTQRRDVVAKEEAAALEDVAKHCYPNAPGPLAEYVANVQARHRLWKPDPSLSTRE